jgi:hypothetical protein
MFQCQPRLIVQFLFGLPLRLGEGRGEAQSANPL